MNKILNFFCIRKLSSGHRKCELSKNYYNRMFCFLTSKKKLKNCFWEVITSIYTTFYKKKLFLLAVVQVHCYQSKILGIQNPFSDNQIVILPLILFTMKQHELLSLFLRGLSRLNAKKMAATKNTPKRQIENFITEK